MEIPRTAAEMNRSLGIPISACYTRIRHLESLGLLNCVEHRVSPSGKQIAVYQSQLKKATIFMDRGEVRVKMELCDGQVEDLPLLKEQDLL